MKNILITGAVFCCLIGVYFVSSFAFEVVRLRPDVPNDSRSLAFILVNYWAMPAYALLAFSPGIILIQARRTEMPHRRLAIVATAELIVFVAFLAMLLAMRFPSL
jgi:hypothetical protein